MEYQRVSAGLRKLVKSLSEAKHRRQHQLFVAEGTKCVSDTLEHFCCKYLLATSLWIEQHQPILKKLGDDCEVLLCDRADMERMTHLSTPSDVIAVYDIPQQMSPEKALAEDELVVALDRIQDPGNLGTIIRLCDWMGVSTILASTDTADVWSPKVIQSTMGGISRVKIIYCDLAASLSATKLPIYGTFLDGDNIYTSTLSTKGIVVMGNEGNGISQAVEAAVTSRLRIPSYPEGRPTSESLNVAMATGIVLAEFRRRQLSTDKNG